jgi:hypothetical protein
VEFIGYLPARLRVPALELSTSQDGPLSHQTTRVMQKVKEAEGKGKVKVIVSATLLF